MRDFTVVLVCSSCCLVACGSDPETADETTLSAGPGTPTSSLSTSSTAPTGKMPSSLPTGTDRPAAETALPTQALPPATQAPEPFGIGGAAAAGSGGTAAGEPTSDSSAGSGGQAMGGSFAGGAGVGGAGAGGAGGQGGASHLAGAGGVAVAGAGGEPNANAGGMSNQDGCPFNGSVVYTFNGEQAWPSDVVELLTAAMDEAVWYYNCYAELSHTLTVNYDGGVPTAQANVDGWITFGSDRGYMVVATAMHEVGHTMGVGYSPWTELTDQDRRWTGEAVNALMAAMPEAERDPGEPTFITADSQHFWPYGLNYASEHVSEWSLINHVRIVAAMQVDKDAARSR